MARDWVPLNKEYWQSPEGNMGGLEYPRPGGLEAWRMIARWEVLVGLEAWQVFSHARRSERLADTLIYPVMP